VLARNGTAAFLFLFDTLYAHVQLQIDKRDQQWKDHILAMHFTCRLPISVSRVASYKLLVVYMVEHALAVPHSGKHIRCASPCHATCWETH
jgi:hypothetical protein